MTRKAKSCKWYLDRDGERIVSYGPKNTFKLHEWWDLITRSVTIISNDLQMLKIGRVKHKRETWAEDILHKMAKVTFFNQVITLLKRERNKPIYSKYTKGRKPHKNIVIIPNFDFLIFHRHELFKNIFVIGHVVYTTTINYPTFWIHGWKYVATNKWSS